MKGQVYEINQQRGMVAILTEDGDYSIFELLSGDPVEKGHTVVWKNPTGLGHQTLTNITKGRSILPEPLGS